MKLLRKYTLKQLAIPFLLSLSLFTVIFIVGNLVKLADLLMNKGVSIMDILKLLMLLTPKLLGFVLPTSILAAILLTFGSFSQHNEITAIKASGVNIREIMSPIMVIGFLLSLVALILNDQIVPQATHAYRNLVKEILIKNPAAYLEAGRLIKDFPDIIILAQKIEGNHIEGITIYQPQENKPTRTIVAEKGEIISSPDDQSLTLKLYNGSSDEPNPDDPEVFYKLDFETFELPPIRLGEEVKRGDKKIKDMTLDELVLEKRKLDPKDENARRRILDLRAEFHQKIAFSFAAFVFTMIGLPLGIITRRGEVIVSFALAMAMVALYYVLFIWARTIGSHGDIHPAVALWLPNIFILIVSFFLLRKVMRT